MNNFLTNILGNKKEWQAMEARANMLPSGYGIFYGDTTSYLDRSQVSLTRDVATKLAG